MKNIIQYNPNINVGAEEVLMSDIILVFKKEDPVGYVFCDKIRKGFKLYINFDNGLDSDISTENILFSNKEIYDSLGDLINDYPELTFKIV